MPAKHVPPSKNPGSGPIVSKRTLVVEDGPLPLSKRALVSAPEPTPHRGIRVSKVTPMRRHIKRAVFPPISFTWTAYPASTAAEQDHTIAIPRRPESKCSDEDSSTSELVCAAISPVPPVIFERPSVNLPPPSAAASSPVDPDLAERYRQQFLHDSKIVQEAQAHLRSAASRQNTKPQTPGRPRTSARTGATTDPGKDLLVLATADESSALRGQLDVAHESIKGLMHLARDLQAKLVAAESRAQVLTGQLVDAERQVENERKRAGRLLDSETRAVQALEHMECVMRTNEGDRSDAELSSSKFSRDNARLRAENRTLINEVDDLKNQMAVAEMAYTEARAVADRSHACVRKELADAKCHITCLESKLEDRCCEVETLERKLARLVFSHGCARARYPARNPGAASLVLVPTERRGSLDSMDAARYVEDAPVLLVESLRADLASSLATIAQLESANAECTALLTSVAADRDELADCLAHARLMIEQYDRDRAAEYVGGSCPNSLANELVLDSAHAATSGLHPRSFSVPGPKESYDLSSVECSDFKGVGHCPNTDSRALDRIKQGPRFNKPILLLDTALCEHEQTAGALQPELAQLLCDVDVTLPCYKSPPRQTRHTRSRSLPPFSNHGRVNSPPLNFKSDVNDFIDTLLPPTPVTKHATCMTTLCDPPPTSKTDAPSPKTPELSASGGVTVDVAKMTGKLLDLRLHDPTHHAPSPCAPKLPTLHAHVDVIEATGILHDSTSHALFPCTPNLPSQSVAVEITDTTDELHVQDTTSHTPLLSLPSVSADGIEMVVGSQESTSHVCCPKPSKLSTPSVPVDVTHLQCKLQGTTSPAPYSKTLILSPPSVPVDVTEMAGKSQEIDCPKPPKLTTSSVHIGSTKTTGKLNDAGSNNQNPSSTSNSNDGDAKLVSFDTLGSVLPQSTTADPDYHQKTVYIKPDSLPVMCKGIPPSKTLVQRLATQKGLVSDDSGACLPWMDSLNRPDAATKAVEQAAPMVKADPLAKASNAPTPLPPKPEEPGMVDGLPPKVGELMTKKRPVDRVVGVQSNTASKRMLVVEAPKVKSAMRPRVMHNNRHVAGSRMLAQSSTSPKTRQPTKKMGGSVNTFSYPPFSFPFSVPNPISAGIIPLMTSVVDQVESVLPGHPGAAQLPRLFLGSWMLKWDRRMRFAHPRFFWINHTDLREGVTILWAKHNPFVPGDRPPLGGSPDDGGWWGTTRVPPTLNQQHRLAKVQQVVKSLLVTNVTQCYRGRGKPVVPKTVDGAAFQKTSTANVTTFLVIKAGTRRLDLQAPEAHEHSAWLQGLEYLLHVQQHSMSQATTMSSGESLAPSAKPSRLVRHGRYPLSRLSSSAALLSGPVPNFGGMEVQRDPCSQPNFEASAETQGAPPIVYKWLQRRLTKESTQVQPISVKPGAMCDAGSKTSGSVGEVSQLSVGTLHHARTQIFELGSPRRHAGSVKEDMEHARQPSVRRKATLILSHLFGGGMARRPTDSSRSSSSLHHQCNHAPMVSNQET